MPLYRASSTVARGGVVNWIGDSIAPGLGASTGYGPSSAGEGVQLSPEDLLAWAHLLSNARVLYGKPAGVGGERADQMKLRITADALSSGGQWCGITAGTNDASAGRTAVQFATDIRAMCAAIIAAGQTPILTTGVPNLAAGSPSQRQLMDRYRRFMASYALENGWPLVDWYSQLVDPTTGGYLSAYDFGDGTHPNPAGKKVMGQALADALIPFLPPWSPALPAINTAAQTANLIPNPLFLVDTNVDGVPDSWTKSGTGATYSIITDEEEVEGYVLRVTDSASGGYTQCNADSLVDVGSLIGHRLAFTGLVKNAGVSTSVLGVRTGGAATNLALRAVNSLGAVTGWQRFYLECVVPVGASSLAVSLQTGGGPAVDLQIAQVGLYSLTDAGL